MLRVSLAKAGVLARPMARTTFMMLPPSMIAPKTRPSRMVGKAHIASIIMESTWSTALPCVAGDDADYGADDRRNEHRKHADGDGDARAVEHAAEHVAAEDVGAEPVGRGWGRRGRWPCPWRHGHRGISYSRKSRGHDEKEHRSAENGGFSLGEPLYPSATLGHRLFFSAVHVETPPNICADILISPRR